MNKILFLIILFSFFKIVQAQKLPCSNPVYRQFDFWLGEWEAFGLNGSKAGDSKISVILDSCSILEEWTSTGVQQGIRFAGKSYNTYNKLTKQWQQTWVDNTGGTTEYLQGKYEGDKIIFKSLPFKFKKDSLAVRRLTFYKLSNNKVRQYGEISTNDGVTYTAEFDLEYRKKENNPVAIADTLLNGMANAYNSGNFQNIANYYTNNGKVVGKNVLISGQQNLIDYWKSFSSLGGKWKLTTQKAEFANGQIWQKGISIITDKNNKQHKVEFTLIIVQENNEWKILQDAYW